MRDRTITCPAGEQLPITLGAKIEYPAETCRSDGSTTRPPQTRRWPGPHDRDGFEPVGALGISDDERFGQRRTAHGGRDPRGTNLDNTEPCDQRMLGARVVMTPHTEGACDL